MLPAASPMNPCAPARFHDARGTSARSQGAGVTSPLRATPAATAVSSPAQKTVVNPFVNPPSWNKEAER